MALYTYKYKKFYVKISGKLYLTVLHSIGLLISVQYMSKLTSNFEDSDKIMVTLIWLVPDVWYSKGPNSEKMIMKWFLAYVHQRLF